MRQEFDKVVTYLLPTDCSTQISKLHRFKSDNVQSVNLYQLFTIKAAILSYQLDIDILLSFKKGEEIDLMGSHARIMSKDSKTVFSLSNCSETMCYLLLSQKIACYQSPLILYRLEY